jgi:hypothetical protein
MAQANPGYSSERKPARRRSPNSSAARSAGSARSSPSRSGKTSDSKSERSRGRAKSAGRRAASSKGTANASRRRPSQVSSRSRALGRASGNGQKSKANASKAPVVAGLATAAAGLVGGVILGTRLAGKPSRVLGVPVPGTGRRLRGLVGQVGKASKQFKSAGKQVGELTNEVRAVREKAEEIGRAIS